MQASPVLLLGVLCAPLAFATPVCISGTLADYTALGSAGCTCGGIEFSAFSYSAAATRTSIPPASSILVQPSASPMYAFTGSDFELVHGTGFYFLINAVVRPIRNPDFTQTETILDMTIAYQMRSRDVVIAAAVVPLVGADTLGTATVLTGISAASCSLYRDGTQQAAIYSYCGFDPRTFMTVEHRAHLNSGYGGSTGAGIGLIQARYITTPEPAAGALAGVALALLASRKRGILRRTRTC